MSQGSVVSGAELPRSLPPARTVFHNMPTPVKEKIKRVLGKKQAP